MHGCGNGVLPGHGWNVWYLARPGWFELRCAGVHHPSILPTAASPTPREIRRAFGPRALDVINSQSACVAELQQRVLALEHDLQILEEGLSGVAREACCARAVTDRRSFWGRLRWLVTGR